MWRVKLNLLMGSFLCILLLMAVNQVYAHNVDYTLNFADFNEQQLDHDDEDPFKGWLSLSVTNSGSDAWGDFHFQIYEVQGFGSVENVHFLSEAPNQPQSSQSGLTWEIDNEVVGATADLYFYGDPVLPGDTATFSVYTDNPDHVGWFGVSVYPTPVPVPGALWLLGSGLLGLLGIKRK